MSQIIPPPPCSNADIRPAPDQGGKRKLPSALVKQFHAWHWMSSAICLAGMLLFAITGITLNHAGSIESEPVIVSDSRELPEALLTALSVVPDGADENTAIPEPVADWVASQFDISLSGRKPEWGQDELYVALPRPGGDGWVSIDRTSGEVTYEDTGRGLIAYFNDLHKGRDTGLAWSLFLDIFAVACVIFSLTGLLLLQVHARKRRSTWPIVGMGVIIPMVLMILMMH